MRNVEQTARNLEHHQPEEVLCPEAEGEPAILARESREVSRHEAVFVLDFAGSVRSETQARPGGSAARLGERILKAALAGVGEAAAVDLVYRGGRNTPFQWEVQGRTHSAIREKAILLARDLVRNVSAALAAAEREFRFKPLADPEQLRAALAPKAWSATIRPRALHIGRSTSLPIGLGPRSSVPVGGALRLPHPPAESGEALDLAAAGLLTAPVAAELAISVEPVVLDAEQIGRVQAALERLRRGPCGVLVEHGSEAFAVRDEMLLGPLQEVLEAWVRHGAGYRVGCRVAADEPVPASVLAMIAGQVFPGRPVSVEVVDAEAPGLRCLDARDEAPLDLTGLVPADGVFPPVLPDAETLGRAASRRFYNRELPHLPDDGLLLGAIREGAWKKDVRLNRADRSRHLYVLGATGTGKSTLLANMIIQDVRNGEGVCLIDPHGDLFLEVLEAVPPSRYDDIVLINPCDAQRAVGINFLECTGPNKAAQINFIVNEVIKVFEKLYDMRWAGGPVFELYMRNALMLVMDNEVPGATLLDVPLLFEDKEFRRFMLSKCKNPLVASFWKCQAERAGHDYSLSNMAPYITSKLNQFTHNAVMRPIIAQSRSTIDFRRVLDERKILLVNLSKGLLGQLDTELLGMFIIGKIFAAATSRVSLRAEERTPCFVYIDEFQNFTTDTVAHLLAESRKFGLNLTLANQNLTQLDANHGQQRIKDALLGNVGSIVAFRLGVCDADAISKHTEPEFAAKDLQELPDFHAVARLLDGNRQTRPFVFQTDPKPDVVPDERLSRAVAAARRKYSRPIKKVEAEIVARRERLKERARQPRM